MTTPRPLLQSLILAVLLPGVAGAVNAAGFFAVGTYTSHVTGYVARVGDELAQHNFATALFFAGLLAAFFLGAVASTVLVELAQRQRKARFVNALLVEAGTLGLVSLLSVRGIDALAPGHFYPIALLGFAMGMQNALVTKISGAVVRTTHLTGIVTDLGIESVRLFFYAKQAMFKANSRGVLQGLATLPRHPELAKLRLHGSILASFFAGATLGPAVYIRIGTASMLLPMGVLLLLAAFDARMGLAPRSDSAHPAPVPAPVHSR